MLSERNYCRDEVLGCILFNVIVPSTLETVRGICWLANLPEISNTVKTTMKTKMATSPIVPTVSHSRFLKLLTRFHKKSTHRNLLRTLMYKTQKDHQRRHALPHAAINFQQPASFSFKSTQIWEKFYKTDATTRSIGLWSTKPENFKPKSPGTRCYTPPKRSHDLSNDLRPSPLNLCNSAHNFRKLTIPWSSTALDPQNLKILGPKRATTRRHVLPE